MKAIHAIYENGVFRPTEPVELPEHARVRVLPETTPQRTSMKAQTGNDLLKFKGTVEWPEDALDWQRRTRDGEWA